MAAELVTVIIPCYNHGRYLAEAVESVVAQRYPHWEAVIIDDGSTDNTASVAEQLIARYPQHRIRLIRQPNAGLGASRNAGIAAAQGRYLLPLDADDRIEPDMLGETVAVLDARPDVGFVYTDVHMVGVETTLWSGGAYSLDKLRFDCPMVPVVLFRAEAARAVGGFHGNLFPQGYEDWDFWLRLAKSGWEGFHIARPFVRYRRNNGSMLATARLHDLELRAQLVLNHAELYEPGYVAWAERVCSPRYTEHGSVRSSDRWWQMFVAYVVLTARYQPRLLPKTLVRPLFCRLSARQQGYARRVARVLRMTQASLVPRSSHQ